MSAKHTERDPAKLARLKSLRDLVEGRHTVAKFRDPIDLAPQVAADLDRLAEKSRRPEPPEDASARSSQQLTALELEIAADIPRQSLPNRPLRGDGFNIAGLWVQARSVGGDYCDFFAYSNV
jgi:hypothetical protein